MTALTRLRDRLPLTGSGLAVLSIGAVSFIGAIVVGWLELFVVAAGCLLALVVSVPFVVGRTRVLLERSIEPDRVTVGDDAVAHIVATNTGSAPAPARQIMDYVSLRDLSVPVPLELPTVAPKAVETVSHLLPTGRRGQVTVGPARILKSDPFGLMQRDAGQTGVDTLWVQPRVVPCPQFAAGIAKDVEGPTFDTSPAGDVAFHAVRPYQVGDDARHVHWMATAKTGEMMVRHYVDNRQPYLSVVLDPNTENYVDDRQFDVAVDVAASLTVSSLQDRRPVSLHLGAESLVGRNRPASPQSVLDDLTVARLGIGFDLLGALPGLVAAERETSVVVAITGPVETDAFLLPISVLRRSSYVVVVRVVDEEHVGSATLGGARVLNVASLEDFASLARVVTAR